MLLIFAIALFVLLYVWIKLYKAYRKSKKRAEVMKMYFEHEKEKLHSRGLKMQDDDPVDNV